ncbi:MAG: Phosphinothricin N-acetyltransferase [Frankiales bacterium]|nr:Phosphinothricin N-acetyltransferase [Frankiales bacterium]
MTLRVRPARPADATAIAAVYGPHVTGSVASFEGEPPDAAEVARRMAFRPRLPWLVAERDAVVVGFADASPHRSRAAYRWSVDTSVYLTAQERGRGTGRALYDVLLPLLRDLGLVTAHAAIALPNPASVALHETVGFSPVGVYPAVGFKHGAWRDVGWWRLALVEPPAAPAEPREWVPEP